MTAEEYGEHLGSRLRADSGQTFGPMWRRVVGMGYCMKAIRQPEIHFDMNVWMAGRIATKMDRFGMLSDGEIEPDYWPRFPDGFDGFNLYTEDVEDVDPSTVLPVVSYAAQCDEVRRRGAEGCGIPVWKIAGTNDGWIVTPAEIASAMSAWYAADQPMPDDGDLALWGRWIQFLAFAGINGGFSTH